MKISGQMNEADYVRSQHLHLRPKRLFVIAGALFSLLATWVAYKTNSLPIMLAYIAFLPIYFGLMQPFFAKRNFRLYKALSEPTVVEVRENGLFFKRTNGEGLVPWSEIIKWKKSPQLILLYPSKRLFHIVPAHFFESENDFQSFANQIDAKIGKST